MACPKLTSEYYADRFGKYFNLFYTLDNSSSSVSDTFDIYAVKYDSGNSQDVVTNQSLSVFLPQTPESFTYDDDGNMLTDGRWTYTWNGENRLIKQEISNDTKIEYSYDYQGRRFEKKVYSWNTGTSSWDLDNTYKFVYDGWNCIAVYDGSNVLQKSYLWGEDLISVYDGTDTYFAVVDGNSNIMAYVDASDGSTVAEYSYDPFGKEICKYGSKSDDFAHKFSSYYTDSETNLIYYGYRYYNPALRRWINRDPIGEDGGYNLYCMTENDAVNLWDYLGMVTYEQINKIAAQLEVPPVDQNHSNATVTIKKIQKILGVVADGDFGPNSVAKYEAWAKANGKNVVELRDSKTAKQVLTWIEQYWPSKHKCAKYCPVYYGEFLALIYYESRDKSTRTGGKPYTYFNAIGGPYASRTGGKLIGTTAVGLAQFTDATASREIAYSGEQSIAKALDLMFKDASQFDCSFEPEKNEKILQRGLNRWEAWRKFKPSIKSQGEKINDLIKDKYEGDASKVANTELNSILGI